MENKEIKKHTEFGEFGEIQVKNCYICNKTILQRYCYGFTREKDMPMFNNLGNGTIQPSQPKSHICLKCLLKGIYTICPDKQQLNKYIDLFTKIAISEELNKQTNQKV